jgi:hypothetical protein
MTGPASVFMTEGGPLPPEAAMRGIVLAGAVIASVVGFWVSPSQAYENGRWCAFVGMNSGVIRSICHFQDFDSCLAEALGGDRGHCGPNPYWSGQGAISSPGKPARKR